MLLPSLRNCLPPGTLLFLAVMSFSLLRPGVIVAGQTLEGQNVLAIRPRDRITQFIDDDRRIVLRGNRHPLATAANDTGRVSGDYRMERMILTLKPDPTQQAGLERLMQSQHDPESPAYHRWLTPVEYGQRFGVSESDLQQIVNWLRTHGLDSVEIAPSRSAIVFGGAAAQVETAFHTQIRTFRVADTLHHANSSDPEIPGALSAVVAGVVSLHDFRSQPMHTAMQRPVTEFSAGGTHYLTPSDFAAIYDVGALYQQSIDGTGQSIAIVGRSNLNISDVRQFREAFGLPANDPQIIVNGVDPGILNSGEESEAALDVEWSGAVARNATIKFVVSASTGSSDGTYLSAQYIVNHNLAPVMSMSFGLCEAALGASGNSFINSLWRQAAAQGITVFVSSGDSGAAGCDSSSSTLARAGRGVNGLCSSPYSVCVGGTQFSDSNYGRYWASANASGTMASALGYIPEAAWNESGGAGLWAGCGGVSTVYAKPAWQGGPGVPASGKRDVPDVALAAAGHDGYLIYMNGNNWVLSGTSASSPSLAGLMALVVQSMNAAQGNADTVFYSLANKQKSGGAAVFHDVAKGNNSVPGLSGFKAGTGYDMATGLGSVDAYVLVSHWTDVAAAAAFRLDLASTAMSVTAGSASGKLNAQVSLSGGFNGPVALAVSGLPPGVSAKFAPASLSAPGSGTSTLNLKATAATVPGNYSPMVSATSQGSTTAVLLSLTVAPAPTFALGVPQSPASLNAGSTAQLTFNIAATSTFDAAVALNVTGVPSGMTASFSPARIAAPGSGSSTLTLTTASSTVPGNYMLGVKAIGGGVTRTTNQAISVPGFTLKTSAASVVASSTKPAQVTIGTAAKGGFSSNLSLSVSGVPSGVTARFSPTTISAPGTGSVTLTLTKGTSASNGPVQLTISVTGGGVTQNAVANLSVK
ncbi:MAG: S53 family peptidase [Terriglobales bacterium]